MKILTCILLSAIPSATTHAENNPAAVINVLGAVEDPQEVEADGPRSLSNLFSVCGGVSQYWSQIIVVTKIESEILTITKRYDLRKQKPEEIKDILDSISVLPGEVVYIGAVHH